MNKIIDILWRYNSKNQQYSQELKLYSEEDKEEKTINLEGFKFNWKLSKERFCPGYYLDGKYNPCPFDKVLEKKTYQNCYHCEQQQGFKAAFLFNQKPNENMQKYLSKKHLIYLAWFAPDKIKVGTSAESRKFIRPIEQDALVYCFIAESDGFNIQKLEREISKSFDVTETVRSANKFKNLGYKSLGNEPKQFLKSYYQKIYDKFKINDNFRDWLFEEEQIEIIDLRNLENLFYPEKEVQLLFNTPPASATPPTLGGDQLILSGDFEGLRGRFTLFENGGNIFAVDEREIIGRKIVDYLENYNYVVNSKSDDSQLSLL